MLRSAIAAAMIAWAARAAAEDFTTGSGGFARVASQSCEASGRRAEIRAWERVDREERTAAWMLEACVTQDDLPVTCLATMTEAEPLPEGMDASGRSFAIRCVPGARLAWIVDLKWTAAGLDLQAWKLDLAPLLEAPIVTLDDGARVIQSPAGAQLVPQAPVPWTAPDPRPLPECVPLTLALPGSGEDLDVIVRAASPSCTSWKVTYSAERGAFTASPLPGSATPDLLRDAPKEPLVVQPGRPTAEVPGARARRVRPASPGFTSMSRR